MSKSSTVTEAELLPNPSPGEILLEEFLTPLALSQTALARKLHVSPRRINDQWRICFLWREGGPSDVEVVDYH